MPIRRRSKGTGGGRFTSGERCEQVDSDVPLGMSTQPTHAGDPDDTEDGWLDPRIGFADAAPSLRLPDPTPQEHADLKEAYANLEAADMRLNQTQQALARAQLDVRRDPESVNAAQARAIATRHERQASEDYREAFGATGSAEARISIDTHPDRAQRHLADMNRAGAIAAKTGSPNPVVSAETAWQATLDDFTPEEWETISAGAARR